MSAFVGIRSLDGAAVEPELLRRLTAALTYCAPDATAAWISGGVGLGFAELRRTPNRVRHNVERAPMPAVNRGAWLVADADLAQRERLIAELNAVGRGVSAAAPDHDLIAEAYHTWGAECATHLHGDFSFALWDSARARLLLTRDRFGTRPLYHARVGGVFVFSNSLDVVRMYPGVSSELDEGAVGDMLRVGYNSDPATTVFAAVRCVPAAHTMVVTGGDTIIRRYWELPIEGAVRFRRVEDYADRFAELLEFAVADCVHGLDDAAILLSGGRDSTAVAAMARSVLDRAGAPRLHAVTAVFDYAIPDQERTYASMAAAGLGIPVDFMPQDEYGWYESWDRVDLWRPEPPESPELAADAAIQACAAAHARVALTGEGGDAALRETESRLARLLQSGHWWRALTETAEYMRWHRRIPRPGFRRQRQRRAGLTSPYSPVPPWMRPEFIARANLNERWRALEADDARVWYRHAVRPEAYSKLSTPFWARCFEEEHSTATGHHLTLRHPFFDERVVDFLLALPAAQWLNDKGIVVASMRHRLPRRVVFRNKTPLAGDSFDVAFRASGAVRPDRSVFDDAALRFIDPELLFSGAAESAEFDKWNWVRAYSLALWLRRLPTGRAFVQPTNPVQLEVGGSM